MKTRSRETVELPGAQIEVERIGDGPPLVLLQSAEAYEAGLDLVDRLAGTREVFLPWAPGYGGSPLPEAVRTIDDVAYIYLDLIEHYDLRGAVLVGCSLGGWIAAEMATKTCERLSRLVLVDPLGAKFGGAYDRDIEDIYFLPFDRVKAIKFADPRRDPLDDMTGLSEDQAIEVARHRETTARLCWEPYFHNPALTRRLHRIAAPTLVLWGADDRFVSPEYGRAYAGRIPDSRFVSIARAGHYPHIEQPDAFMDAVSSFLDGGKG